ncbi:putative xp-G/rad2 DNA repair endonuclease family [Fasciolopsis buskii]|uniref:Putative xp-G/rad2 DNA repair endonuclease family n=1 Tax=Fasciolopsis buskii TaxID=27845 RepID=A0A8E0SA70_9TREM|nr:putative xp-G/rad2 DNA repair endonuclease family [Fasciolopsis buski]
MPFVISPEEAEAQCVTLQRVDLVDLVASDDSDVWPFGARHVCRHLFGTVNESRSKVGKGHKSKLHSPSCYCLEDVRASLGLDVANILQLAMLCGSDYTPGIRNVGPVTAVEILSEFVRQAPQSNEQDDQWSQWLCGMHASDSQISAVIGPLKDFVDWWNNCGSRKPLESQLVTSPVRRKWANLHPPSGFPDPAVVQAYLRPNVKTELDSFKWEVPNVSLLVKYPFSREPFSSFS